LRIVPNGIFHFTMSKTILSYNVNGIRAALNKGLSDWLKSSSPDVFCVQETKAGPAQIDIPLFEHLGYHCYVHSAEKKGYSGVMILSKEEPLQVIQGMGIEKYDMEGRVLRADFPYFTLINVYIPSGTTGDVRQDFKMEFLDDFKNFINALRKEKSRILICGDYNICHKPIDINHPERHKNSSGFLPEERDWFDHFIADGLVDTFRLFNAQPEQYSWWSYRANSRAKNLGWRIDYHIVSDDLKPNVKEAGILKEVVHSDHCPVSVVLDL
jgi:exodeoxyribonuclease III